MPLRRKKIIVDKIYVDISYQFMDDVAIMDTRSTLFQILNFYFSFIFLCWVGVCYYFVTANLHD